MGQIVTIAIFALAVLIAVCIGIFVYIFLSADVKQKAIAEYEKLKDKNLARVKRDADKYYSYNAMKAKMVREGINYRLGDKVTPFDYIMIRAGICIAAFLVGFLVNPTLGIVFLIGAYIIVPLNYSQENKKDNEEMLDDIGKINGVLALQVKNGVYITKVIYECYRMCKNRRLKKALLELSVEIESMGVDKAVDAFLLKFDNQHINMFGKCIKQIESSGQTANFFENLNASIASINAAVALKEEQKAKNVGGIFEVLIFLAIILFTFYVLYISMLGGASSVF